MGVKRLRLLCIIIGFTVGLLLTGATQLAAQDNCQPLYDAMNKVITTPTHIYTTTNTAPNSGGKPRTIETIYAAGSTYVNFNGKWTRGPTPQQVVKQEDENRRNSKASCRYLHNESINGETAAVYSTQTETSDQKSDGQMWISKTRGLPLRQELDVDTGDKSGKSHHSVRYEYKNVQPPLP
jgi:hypothetical protein